MDVRQQCAHQRGGLGAKLRVRLWRKAQDLLCVEHARGQPTFRGPGRAKPQNQGTRRRRCTRGATRSGHTAARRAGCEGEGDEGRAAASLEPISLFLTSSSLFAAIPRSRRCPRGESRRLSSVQDPLRSAFVGTPTSVFYRSKIPTPLCVVSSSAIQRFGRVSSCRDGEEEEYRRTCGRFAQRLGGHTCLPRRVAVACLRVFPRPVVRL